MIWPVHSAKMQKTVQARKQETEDYLDAWRGSTTARPLGEVAQDWPHARHACAEGLQHLVGIRGERQPHRGDAAVLLSGSPQQRHPPTPTSLQHPVTLVLKHKLNSLGES
jgi:hypothetical protein